MPTVGGVERYTHNLALRLVQKGHRVIIVTSLLDNLPKAETQNGIEIIRVPSFIFMNGRFPVAKPSNIIAQLCKIKIDFIVIQTRLYPLCLIGARLAKKQKIKAIVIEHGTAHLFRGGILGVLGNIYEHVLTKAIYTLCPNFYGVSKACASWLLHFNIKTNKVLHNAVSETQIAQLANDYLAKNNFLQPYLKNTQKPITICFSGRFIPEKGVLPLLEAFENLNKKHPSTLLFLAGNGPQFEQAQKALPPCAHLLSMLSYEQNLALVASCDIYCLPTFSEGFSTSILEAAALKTAIITTKTGGSPELILNESYGILLQDMNPKTIEIALEKAVQNENWRKTATENAYNQLTQNFTWDIVCAKLLQIASEKEV